jgi:hypothetical protein
MPQHIGSVCRARGRLLCNFHDDYTEWIAQTQLIHTACGILDHSPIERVSTGSPMEFRFNGIMSGSLRPQRRYEVFQPPLF